MSQIFVKLNLNSELLTSGSDQSTDLKKTTIQCNWAQYFLQHKKLKCYPYHQRDPKKKT